MGARRFVISFFLFCGCIGIISFAITGCTSSSSFAGRQSGNVSISQLNSERIDQIIIIGKTSQEDIRSMFGIPNSTKVSKNQSIWNYSYAKTDHNYSVKAKLLAISFDKNKLVINYNFYDAQ